MEFQIFWDPQTSAISAWICEWCPAFSCQTTSYYHIGHEYHPAIPPDTIHPSLSSPHTTRHTQLYIWRWCVWISLCVPAFPQAAFVLVICHMSPSHQRHRNIWSCEQRGRITPLKASSLIAHGSIPTISNLRPYLLSFIAEAWRPLDSWEKWPPNWAWPERCWASVYTCSSPQRPACSGWKMSHWVCLFPSMIKLFSLSLTICSRQTNLKTSSFI